MTDNTKAEDAQPLRVGVFGTGYGAVHLANLAACEGVEVVAVWSRTLEAARTTGSRYGVPVCTDAVAQMMELDLDAVAVATPTPLVFDVVSEAVGRGLHVLSEKPLGRSAEDALKLAAAATEAGVVNMTNFDFRTAPDAIELHRRVATGDIGTVRRATFDWLADSYSRGAPWSQRFDRASWGFGALVGFHHVLDEIHWHFGPVERVLARFQTLVLERRDPATGARRPCDVEDAVAFVARTTTGVELSGELNRCVPGSHRRTTQIVGDDGVLELVFHDHRDRTKTSLLRRAEGHEPREVGSAGPPQVTTQKEFVAAIRGGPPVGTPFGAGAAALILAEAMLRSSDDGAWMTLPPVYHALFEPRGTSQGESTTTQTKVV